MKVYNTNMLKENILDAVGFTILVVAAYKITWVLFALPDAPLF